MDTAEPNHTPGTDDLKEHEREVLEELRAWRYGWARPMDLGGRDCSHHSRTLSKLEKLGYAKSRRRVVSIVGALGSNRAGKEYRATQKIKLADNLKA